jgi:protein-S-isoprenylcysteine O-methyltransferase Ste14
MISGMIIVLTGEEMLLQCPPLAAWMLTFFAGNAVYFPLVEEELLNRFGEDYLTYCNGKNKVLPMSLNSLLMLGHL